jgi:single-strand DNA-binding protein
MDANQSIVVGRIAGEVKFTEKKDEKGSSRASFTVAVNRMRGDEADYIPCVCWGKTAENVAKYCAKGKEVTCVGNIRTSGKKDPTTNEWSNFWNLNCNFVSFGRDSKKQQVAGEQGGAPAPLEPDMAKLAEQLAASAKAKKAKTSFDEAKLREELEKAGITGTDADDAITSYKAAHGLQAAAAPAPEAAAPAAEAGSDEDVPF